MRLHISILVALLVLTGCEAGEHEAANDNAFDERVFDEADILSDAAERDLRDASLGLEAETSDQLVVVTTPSLGGRSIDEVSLERGNAMGVGRADIDYGVMIFVAPNERKVRIEVGLGLEALLTDEIAGRIIETSIVPQFRAGNYDQGVRDGVSAIGDVLRSDRVRPRYPQHQDQERLAS